MSKINALQAAALSGNASSAATNSNTSDSAKNTVATKKSPTSKPGKIAEASVKPVAKTKPAVAVKSATTATPASAKPLTKTTKSTSKPTAKPAAKKVDKAAKPTKEKTPKLKMERDSFTMPKVEYAQLYVLKERLIKLGQASKKSELLRAGIMQLSAMTDAALKAAMAKVPAIKTGRPKKK